MLREDALMGGEESGGFGFRGHIPERDGILSGLFILDMMVRTGKRPSELLDYLYSKVGPHYYRRADNEFDAQKRATLETRLQGARPDVLGGRRVSRGDEIVEDGRYTGSRFVLEDGSWVIARFSGTEPLLRIYAEGKSTDRVDTLIDEARTLLGI
jgi:phosphomannomutase